jgi:hypothetical protein
MMTGDGWLLTHDKKEVINVQSRQSTHIGA